VLVQRHEFPVAKIAAVTAVGGPLSQPGVYRAAITAVATAIFSDLSNMTADRMVLTRRARVGNSIRPSSGRRSRHHRACKIHGRPHRHRT